MESISAPAGRWAGEENFDGIHKKNSCEEGLKTDTLTNSIAVSTMESLPTEINGLSPQREAAFFYGLFLRGHPLESLRKDIDVSEDVVSHWETMLNHDPWYREALEIMVPFRKRVLAIFDSLITSELQQPHRQ